MTNRLIIQHESAPDELGRAHGFEIFHDKSEGFYSARFHIRTYNGVRVDSSWASDEVRLNAEDSDAAYLETIKRGNEWIKSLRSPGGE